MSHTVLLVEDEVELRETMHEALELHGYAVVVASDGQAALEQLESQDCVCLVLLDLVMPRMNGWEFFAEMRTRASFASTPVVVHSSTMQAPPDGVARVLRKPVELRRLLSVVRELCTLCQDHERAPTT